MCPKMAHNGIGLGEEADLTAQKMKVTLMFNTAPQLNSSTSAAFLPNPCYAYVPTCLAGCSFGNEIEIFN